MFKKHSPYAERFKQLSHFEGLSDDEVQRIVDNATHVTLPANWSLMGEQTPADKAYVILDGEVSIRQHGKEIARVGAGDTIGEVALVRHTLRTASVVSVTPVEVLHFTSEAVEKLSADIPKFGRALEETTKERINREA